MRYLPALIGGICVSLASFAQKGDKGADPVLFTISTHPTKSSEFLYLFRKNHQGKPDEFKEPKIREYLDLFVNFKLKVREARTRGLDTTKAFVTEFNSYRDELRKPYLAGDDALDRLVKEVYERLCTEIKASHILVTANADAPPSDTLAAYNKALEIGKRLASGELFEKLAAELSQDPSAKQNGGSLGYFTALQMVYPFEDAAYKLNPGETSGPVRTRFGYHLIKVYDKRPASGEVEVSHILLRGSDEKVRNRIFDVYDQLKAGRKWDDLCREFSEDAGTREKGGRLNPFGVGALTSVPEFEAMAFSLGEPGEVSDPFRSSIGWHVIRLEKKIPLPPFKEMEPALRKRISRDERLQLSQAVQMKKRMKELGFEEKEDVRRELAALADTSLQKGRWSVKPEGARTGQVLFQTQAGPVYSSELISFIKTSQRPSALPPATYFEGLYNQFADQKLKEVEDAKLVRENPEYRNLLNEYYEGILLFSIMEKEVWNRASEDTLGQRRHYDANKEKYRAGERVSAKVYATSQRAFLDEVIAKVSRGDTLTPADMRKFKSVTNYRPYEKGENKAVDKIPWSTGRHEAEAEGMYYLVEVDRLIPAGIKSFDEARASVISDYQDELEKSWVSQLRKSYPVRISKKSLKMVIAELTSK